MQQTSFNSLTQLKLQSLLSDGKEFALLDVRSPELFRQGHILLAVNVPMSNLQSRITALVPRKSTRVVICAEDPESGEAAITQLRYLGYSDISVLQGGATAWKNQGGELFEGTYSINNTFSLMVELHYETPQISAQELKTKTEAGIPVTVLDSRPFDEFAEAQIPGAVNLPLAELIYRIRDVVPDPTCEIVVNCGGRARGVLGCQSLINTGISNPVSALYYGTMGWDLANYPCAFGGARAIATQSNVARNFALKAAKRIVRRFDVQSCTPAQLQHWVSNESDRTTYAIDVRSREEFDAGHLKQSMWAPGGELIGVTEDYIATRNARLCLVDDDETRAVLTASWLTQMGWHEVYVLKGGIHGGERAGMEVINSHPASSSLADTQRSLIKPENEDTKAARHAEYQEIIDYREKLPDQLARDGTVLFGF